MNIYEAYCELKNGKILRSEMDSGIDKEVRFVIRGELVPFGEVAFYSICIHLINHWHFEIKTLQDFLAFASPVKEICLSSFEGEYSTVTSEEMFSELSEEWKKHREKITMRDMTASSGC
jgi:hypothetical protein